MELLVTTNAWQACAWSTTAVVRYLGLRGDKCRKGVQQVCFQLFELLIMIDACLPAGLQA